ncbi:LTXXQ domain protein [Pseudomonas sp. TTU2014-080ASC]|uniref:LTXXQ domain protein n=1 Tax=Pseudomonas sp. TTU2014-080ASC TaxID=1729724 RepID=UPI0007185FAC|nr:LTXXQ domain protein [Pseudomonas sp. TTU2014-080ASC]KRW62213.1 LTXXQ domain protein [Pseudomonas sp. TTU2014-080ASC]
MRKTLTAALIALTLPAMAMAMPQGEHRRADDFGPRFAKQLNLTREQSRDIHKAMAESMRTRHDITQRYLDKLPAAEKQAMQDELKAARDKQQSSIRSLLNSEQQKAFDELQKKMQARQAERAEFQAWKAEKDKKAQ